MSNIHNTLYRHQDEPNFLKTNWWVVVSKSPFRRGAVFL